MKKYAKVEKLQPLVAEISWTNNVIILNHTKTIEEKEFYIKTCLKERWSKRELQRQIDSAEKQDDYLMSVAFHVKSEYQSYHSYEKQDRGYYHSLTPFKITRPAVKNKKAQMRPITNMKGLSGKLANTYIPTVSLEISRRYLPKLTTWLSLNSVINHIIYAKACQELAVSRLDLRQQIVSQIPEVTQ